MLLMETVAVPTVAAVKKICASTPLPETPVTPVRLLAMARMAAVPLLMVPVIPDVPPPRKPPWAIVKAFGDRCQEIGVKDPLTPNLIFQDHNPSILQ